MKEGHSTAKCVACGGVFLKKELSDDGRCSKCVDENRVPERNCVKK